MIVQANSLHSFPLAAGSVHCCVTSPPYWGLRDYGIEGQLGLEPTPDEYVANMVSVFREVWRVLRDDGTLWLNLGDSYSAGADNRGMTLDERDRRVGVAPQGEMSHQGWAKHRTIPGMKPKNLCGIPWRVAFALQADGWYLRSEIIWAKPNPMPESVTDRPTKSHEQVFLLSKSPRYFYDAEAVKEDAAYPEGSREDAPRGSFNGKHGDQAFRAIRNSRNRRSVWTVATAPYSGAHFATFPPALVEPCILAGTSARGVCPVCGAPWARVTERTDTPDPSAKGSRFDAGKTGVNGNGRVQSGERYLKVAAGWQPTCACGRADVVPAICLDPFAGSGTTGAVARQHGRRFVGLDINGTYLRELALPRAEGKSTRASLEALPLFQLSGGNGHTA